MADTEQLPAVRIPSYLSIHWVWLLLVGILQQFALTRLLVQTGLHYEWLTWVNAFTIWSFIQAIWLFREDKRSRALFWYLAAAALGIPVQLADQRMLTPQASFPGTPMFWASWIVGTVATGTYLAAIFVFRNDMQRFFRERNNPGLLLGPWMTFFFSIIYFQYYFHDIAKAKSSGLRVTPSSI